MFILIKGKMKIPRSVPNGDFMCVQLDDNLIALITTTSAQLAPKILTLSLTLTK